MVFKVGLTGGVASGKTTVSDLFRQLGIEVIDADTLVRELLGKDSACYQQVLREFGRDVITESGDINRAWLRQRIFSDPVAKKKLESILHPQVRLQMQALAGQCSGPYCILSIPLLVEAGMQDMVDRVLIIDLDEMQQLTRLKARDQIDTEQAQNMLNNQCRREQRLAIADDIIDNQGRAAALNKQVQRLHQFYLELASANH